MMGLHEYNCSHTCIPFVRYDIVPPYHTHIPLRMIFQISSLKFYIIFGVFQHIGRLWFSELNKKTCNDMTYYADIFSYMCGLE